MSYLPSDPSLTIGEFCQLERISRSLLYRMWQDGKGPRYHLVGSHRRISAAARAEWHRQQEAEAERIGERDSKRTSAS